MQIVSIGVSGFRQLVDVHDIPLGRPTVLTGANGAGKSTFIRALRVLLDGQIDDRDTDEADYSVDGTFEVRAEDDLPGLAEGDSVRLRRLVDSHGAVALERFAARSSAHLNSGTLETCVLSSRPMASRRKETCARKTFWSARSRSSPRSRHKSRRGLSAVRSGRQRCPG
jgi:ATPase subunit of ABC transporter with duplicated ATPase domains